MTEVQIRSGLLRKKHFKLDEDNSKLLKEIAEKYGLPEEKVLSYALGNETPEIKGDKKRVEELRKEVDSLLQDMFSVEGKWSAIRYKSHTLSKDVKMLSVVLIGQLSQNRTLRRQLKKEPKYEELRKKAEYYLFDV
ncbi:MAG: hypothetical protein GXO25_00715 [Euryarchaeota archaeon]|nr:hypothetical protein [Euryarchaeota archaeon]